ncbi:LuxR family transcriptional regulator [Luteibacter aegosomaticola]|uniref:response regulator transcription factor n=1 Tax=Luteibacter aegosomaticola TaxID=2911538 RepID=UPI001FFAA14A|nr:helix-turn-helix transcriptional regulator [Luteibacter aegosomaticola]UPG90448.1 LuxR family transcriptional regulator [Luteibacter aegosomaticola]
MCLGRESVDQPQPCALAEGVFSALPMPCVLWPSSGGRAVMVNAAFRREFGISTGRAGPGWLKNHLTPTDAPDEFIFRDSHAAPRRYRVTRELLDIPPVALQAVFLMPLGEEPMPVEAEPPTLASLPPGVSLTRRESQVLDGIMRGKLNKVIASELKISPKTVELHRSNLMAKLRVHNVIELARVVLDTPVAEPEPAIPS